MKVVRNPILGIDDVIVDSLEELDLRYIRIPMFALFDSPKDYPGKFVLRLFDCNEPANAVMLSDSKVELQEHVKGYMPQLYFIPRDPKDTPELIGTYM